MNSSIAAEPALDPVAQADQAKTEEHEARGRGIAGAGQQCDETGEFPERPGGGQRECR